MSSESLGTVAESDSSYLPTDIAKDLEKQFHRSETLVLAYWQLHYSATDFQDSKSLSDLVDGEGVSNFEKWLQDFSIDINYGAFGDEWLNEVNEARRKYIGKFKPAIWADRILHQQRKYDSAFDFVESLAVHFAQITFDTVLDFPDIPRRSRNDPTRGWDSEEEMIRAYNDALHLAFVLGKLFNMPPIVDEDGVLRELARETIAVAQMRSENKSWYALSERAFHKPAPSPLRSRLAAMSDYRKLILRALFRLGARSEENPKSAPQIAEEFRGITEPRLRAALSDLRTQGFIGGHKGQRGYWLTTDAWRLIQEGQPNVLDNVDN